MPASVYQFNRDVETAEGLYRQKATVIADNSDDAARVLREYMVSLHSDRGPLSGAYNPSNPQWRVNAIPVDTAQVIELMITD
jgi:hypothetical protein